MNAQIKKLLTEVDRLAPSERIELFLESLDKPDAEFEQMVRGSA